MLFKLFENTRSLENPSVSLTDASSWDQFFDYAQTITGDSVTEDKALGVTAIWQAVNVISGTLGSLPCQLYKDAADGAVKDTNNPLYYILHNRPNETQTATAFWKWFTSRLVLGGRATAAIIRNKASRVVALIPLDGSKLNITQRLVGNSIKQIYTYSLSGKTLVYDAADVIDVIWMPAADGVTHRNTIQLNRDAIALMIAAQKFSGKLFANGGVPPLTLNSLTSNFKMGAAPSPQAAERASNDVGAAVKASARTKSNILVVPAGHELKPVGIDPSKSQLVELREFLISEASRIFNVQPAILQDLSNGTYSNVEQQNISFAQMTIAPLVELIEAELNAKLFGARNVGNYIKFSMNALLRGDFATRMTGYAQSVQNAIMTPNECRALEELPPLPGGDDLLIQGATVRLTEQGTSPDNTGE